MTGALIITPTELRYGCANPKACLVHQSGSGEIFEPLQGSLPDGRLFILLKLQSAR
jgi:hypothetical protein